MKKNIVIIILLLIIAALVTFIALDMQIVIEPKNPVVDIETTIAPSVKGTPTPVATKKPDDAKGAQTDENEEKTVQATEAVQKTKTPETPKPAVAKTAGKLIVIDAGHQARGNSEKEPIAPGALETKPKVASGTQGVSTKVPEYKVTLAVSQKLKEELTKRGYSVIMVRETNDVNISNSQRAKIANDAGADAFVRIHCNGTNSSQVKGALTMCQTKNNKYCGHLYTQSRALSECVLAGLCSETGAKNRGVSETDTMSGINWCEVPVTIVEMGFMSNPEEDKLLCDDEYQQKLVIGMANGLDNYFGS